MLTCEEFIKKYLPLVRAKTARELNAKGMKQQEIASRLGITQAAVSKYLDRKYDKRLARVEEDRALSLSIGRMAQKLQAGPLEKGEMAAEICRVCENIYKSCGSSVA